MWITNWKYERLCERLDALEREQRELSRQSRIDIDKWPDDRGTWSNRYHALSAADAVRLLAAHLGVRFKYLCGTPDTAALESVKTKK